MQSRSRVKQAVARQGVSWVVLNVVLGRRVGEIPFRPDSGRNEHGWPRPVFQCEEEGNRDSEEEQKHPANQQTVRPPLVHGYSPLMPGRF